MTSTMINSNELSALPAASTPFVASSTSPDTSNVENGAPFLGQHLEPHALSKDDGQPTFVNYRKFHLPWLASAQENTNLHRELTTPHVPGAFEARTLLSADNGVESVELSALRNPSNPVGSPLSDDTSGRGIGSIPSLPRRISPIVIRSSGSLDSCTEKTVVETSPTGQQPHVGKLNLSAFTKALRPSESTVASDQGPVVLPLTLASPSPVTAVYAVPEYRKVLQNMQPPQMNPINDMPTQSNHHAEEALLRSIAGLENLMREAIDLTNDAVSCNRTDVIPEILEGAAQALHPMSNARRNNETVFPHKTVLLDQADYSNSGSEDGTIDGSRSTSHSPSPIPHLQFSPPGRPHVMSSQRGVITRSTEGNRTMSSSLGPRTVWDQPSTDNLLDHEGVVGSSSAIHTPPHSYQQPSSSAALDWAYQGPQASPDGPAPSQPRSRLQRKRGPGLSRPQVAFAPQHDQVNFVSRTGKGVTSQRQHPQPNYSPSDSPSPNNRPNDFDEPTSPTTGPTSSQEPVAPIQKGFGRTATQGRNQAQNWGRDKYDEQEFMTADTLKGVHHLTLRDDQKFSLHHYYRRAPIARNWTTKRKRITAAVACINTALLGNLIGIYSGEVPSIQYALADQNHIVILGNVVLYIGMAITTFFFWPLPLLHGRKPYTLGALAVALPLQFPQAVIVMEQHGGSYPAYQFGLLFSRAVSGLALGFAFINVKTTLLDLFGASLQSEAPHGELVILDDVRRHGGGMGLWIGIWSWCFIGSLAVGFTIGAGIINSLSPQWGFWIGVVLMAVVLVLSLLTPETRRSPHRRILQEVELPNMSFSRRVARGEIRMHVKGDGPKWWWQEVTSGIQLSIRMMLQPGFAVMAIYVAWIYAEIVLIIVLLGNLLSRGYGWRAEYVGLGVLSIAIGALLAVPLSLANIFSKSRTTGPRTDSMTFQPRVTWTSHLVRRFVFMIMLPISGIIYSVSSSGPGVHYMVPIVFAGAIGFFSNLAVSECHGLIMETYDTSDLQPGTNSRHRLQSMAPAQKRRRTTYSSYPRVSAGFFVAHSLGFLLAAAAVGVGGVLTRTVGYQKAAGITAGILFGLTLLLSAVLWRFKHMQVIPNELFGHQSGSTDASTGVGARRGSVGSVASDQSWRAVIIGNPSGKVRRMSLLELGSLSRWTEIRRMNRLLSRSTTQALNPGWR